MTKKEEPKITSCKPTDNWTSITFKPDLAKFGMDHLEDDTLALMRKRVYDLAGVLGKTCKVCFIIHANTLASGLISSTHVASEWLRWHLYNMMET